MKTYVITLSKTFPVSHKRAGEPTNFKNNLLSTKIHTIRANYPFWEKRISEIQNGEAVLSIRQWTGNPYCSKQTEIMRLSKDDGIGIERLILSGSLDRSPLNEILAQNDGLAFDDWRDWFLGYDRSQPLAIIHFTNFRYGGSI